MPIALVVAAVVAWLNAGSIAALAPLHPESGGTYAYGRARLGAVWGFVAGWAFVSWKLASCTAMALTLGGYAAPEAPLVGRLLGILAVAACTTVNVLGVERTATATRAIVAVVLASLEVAVLAIAAGGAADLGRLVPVARDLAPRGVLQAAAFLFFAFAGYARIATLGEEVRDPARSIPRAIAGALAIALAVYAVVIGATLAAVDTRALAASPAPLALAVESGRLAVLAPLVRLGAAVASLGVLLSLLAGIGRTAFAMAAQRDLPHALAAVHPRSRVPHRAEIAAGVLVAASVAFADLRSSIGFSSFGVLLYYAIAHAAALRLEAGECRRPRALAVLGAAGCLLLAFAFPTRSCSRVMRSRSSANALSACGPLRRTSTRSAAEHVVAVAGVTWHTGIPLRSITTLSPRYWTRFSRSEKPRAAAVPVICRGCAGARVRRAAPLLPFDMESDHQISRLVHRPCTQRERKHRGGGPDERNRFAPGSL